MSTRQLLGNAPAIPKGFTLSPVVVGAGNIFVVTSPLGNAVTYTTPTGTVADVVAGLFAAMTAATAPPEMLEWSVANMTSYLLVQGPPGKPITLSATAFAGNGGGSPSWSTNYSLSTPGAATLGDVSTGGTLNFATAYYYRVTALSPFGETLAHAEQTITTANDALTTHKITVAIAVPRATAYRLYGRSTGAELLIQQMTAATPGASVTLVDDGTITPAGPLPVGNTTAYSPTTSNGPEDFNTAGNWSGQTVPVTGDTLDFTGYTGDLLYNLGQSAIVANNLRAPASFTGKVGLPLLNTDNPQLPFPEYLPTYLALSFTGGFGAFIGQGDGNGCQRFKLDAGAEICNLNVYKTGSAIDTDLPCVLFKGTNASNTAIVSGGSVGIAVLPAEVATLLTLTIGTQGQTGTDATVTCGQFVTLGTVTMYGGTLTLFCPILSALTMYGGTTTAYFLASSGTLMIQSGTLTLIHHGGTVNAVTLSNIGGGNGTLDLSECLDAPGSLTVTGGIDVYPGFRLIDPNGILIAGTVITPHGCSAADLAAGLILGNRALTLG